MLKSEDWGITEDECDLVLEDWGQDVEFGDFSSVLLEVFELFALDSIDSESDDFLDQGLRLND